MNVKARGIAASCLIGALAALWSCTAVHAKSQDLHLKTAAGELIAIIAEPENNSRRCVLFLAGEKIYDQPCSAGEDARAWTLTRVCAGKYAPFSEVVVLHERTTVGGCNDLGAFYVVGIRPDRSHAVLVENDVCPGGPYRVACPADHSVEIGIAPGAHMGAPGETSGAEKWTLRNGQLKKSR